MCVCVCVCVCVCPTALCESKRDRAPSTLAGMAAQQEALLKEVTSLRQEVTAQGKLLEEVHGVTGE